MKTGRRRLLFAICCAVLFVFVTNWKPVTHYVNTVKNKEALPVAVPLGERDEWLAQIEKWRAEKEEQPINAKLDRVWKAVPGYNGLEVDIEATLAKMKAAKTPGPEHLVMREVPPAVALEELGAHPIYRGNPKKPAISFMVNVAWGNEYLDSMLDTFDKHQVKTTFFLDGSWVKRNPEEAKKIVQRGHELGNHAYSHPDMKHLGVERIHQEISRTQAIIEQTTGVKPALFAPPSGSFSQRVVDIAHSSYGMKTILWTADTVDWMKPPPEKVIAKISKLMDNGVLVLMHPTAASEKSLDQLLTLAKQKGLVPTTVSQVISSSRLP
ncbi:polysaccharide deacetylase family protein [Brevibacillus sp. TJ4]